MRISERGQITIPKHVRERHGMTRNIEVEIAPTEKGRLIQKRMAGEHPVDRISGILDNDALGEGVNADEYIKEIRCR